MQKAFELMDEGKTFEKIINIFQQIETCEEVIDTRKNRDDLMRN